MIREEIKERTLQAADYIIATHCTRLECSNDLEIPLTLLEKDIRNRLAKIDLEKYKRVMEIGEENKYRRTSEKAIYMLDFFTFEVLDKYVSVKEVADDLRLSRACLTSAFRDSKNGMYFSKNKELILITQEAYDKLKAN